MKRKLVFNLADREKHMDALKSLYGKSHAKNHTESESITLADSDRKRVSRVQSVLGISKTEAVSE